ncbi:MAG: hypothetical protein SGILL_009644 [Bacillariaceae sp.]
MGVIPHASAVSLAPPSASSHLEAFLENGAFPDSTLSSSNAMTWISSDVIPTTDDMTNTAAATIYEPQLDVPAFLTFFLISVIFSALILRTQQVEQAVQTRNARLERLRDMKSKELAGEEGVSAQDVEKVLRDYEDAVRNEEGLRNVIPGVVRIVPPSAGNEKEQEASVVAKQLLGKDFDIGVPKRERNESGFSALAIGALATVGVLLLGLFVFLNVMYITDPTSPIAGGSI